MNNFIDLLVREKVEGTPGVVKDEEFGIHINVGQITLFNKGEDPKVTFVRLTCGATLCVLMSHSKFVKLLKDIGSKVYCPMVEKNTTKKVVRKKNK